jgi:hypothetical protein
VWSKEEKHTGFWGRNLRKRDNWEDLEVDKRIVLKWILLEVGQGNGRD